MYEKIVCLPFRHVTTVHISVDESLWDDTDVIPHDLMMPDDMNKSVLLSCRKVVFDKKWIDPKVEQHIRPLGSSKENAPSIETVRVGSNQKIYVCRHRIWWCNQCALLGSPDSSKGEILAFVEF